MSDDESMPLKMSDVDPLHLWQLARDHERLWAAVRLVREAMESDARPTKRTEMLPVVHQLEAWANLLWMRAGEPEF